MTHLNHEVTAFLDALNHPMRAEIEELRHVILRTDSGIAENIKWNGPNYTYRNEDRITMKIQPPKQIQLIFHRGVKKLAQPDSRLIEDESKLLVWKENDRAIVTFKTLDEIRNAQTEIVRIVQKWIKATW